MRNKTLLNIFAQIKMSIYYSWGLIILILYSYIIYILYKTPLDCGTVNQQRIVGGSVVTPLKYGWMAMLVNPGANNNFCGGSLISANYVLTAAHCTEWVGEGWGEVD